MNEIEVTLAEDIGGLRFTVCPESRVWLMSAVRPTPKPSGEPLAEHLTVPLAPRDDGKFPGRSGTHLTYAGDRRVWLGNIEFYRFAEVMTHVSDALAEFRRAKAFSVVPELLAGLGMKVMLPRPSLAEWAGRTLGRLHRRYKVARSDLEKVVDDHVEVASPEALHEPWVKELAQPIPVFGLPFTLSHGADGWFASPQPNLDVIAGVVRRCVPPELWGKLDLVSRELGVPHNEPMATWAREAPYYVVRGSRAVRGIRPSVT